MDRDEMERLLARLDVPIEVFSVLGVWPRPEGRLAIHLSPTAFWRVVKRTGREVMTEARDDLLFPYCHRLVVGDIEFFTFSAEPVLPPGTVTPGYALRLT